MNPLLVLVDLQEDFLAEAGLEPHRDTIVAGAAALLEAARGSGVRVVHVHTRVSRKQDDRMPHWKRTGRWTCEDGTPGALAPAALVPIECEVVIAKTGFAVGRDQLAAAARGCDWAVVAGVHTHACVRQAVLDLYELGLSPCVAAEGVASHEPAHAAQAEAWLRQRQIAFLPNATILACFAGEAPKPEPEFDPIALRETVRDVRAPGGDTSSRAAILEKAAALVDEEADAFARLIVEEIGKPIRYARGEVARTAALFRAVARRAAAEPDEVAEDEALVRRRPLGTVAVITPWNNPVAIAAGQLAPAFAFGNTVLWKPSPAAETCAGRLHDILIRAGVPRLSLQLLGGGAETALFLAGAASVDAVCFTGATHSGRVIAAQCGQRNLPLQAELGGNNAAIVTSGARLEDAAQRIAEAAFGCAGQRCTATRRAILLADIYDRFLAALEQSSAGLAWGDPTQEETQVGPMLDDMHAGRVRAIVARAAAAGHAVLRPHLPSGSGGPLLPGAYHPPTIVLCDDPDAEIVQEETFGPVLVVQKARDLCEALALQNAVRQGLGAALFSDRADEQQAFLAAARAGIVKLNQATVEAGVDVPFLGWKASGIGPPQHGAANREFFTRAQSLYR